MPLSSATLLPVRIVFSCKIDLEENLGVLE